MTSIGETLRRERLRRNLELDQISRELKISSRMLEAIEAEQFDKLPGTVFAKNFVRQYAHLLGLEEDEMAAEVQRSLAPETDLPRFADAGTPTVTPIQVPKVKKVKVEEWEAIGDHGFSWSSPLTALALFVVAMLVCSGIYTLYQRKSHPVLAQNSAVSERAPAPVQQAPVQQAPAAVAVPPAAAPETAPPAQETVPTQQTPPAGQSPTPQTPAAQSPAAQSATPQTSAAQSATPRTLPTQSPIPQTPPARSPATQTPPSVAQPAPPQTPTAQADRTTVPAPPVATGPVHLEITAEEPTWVLARGDGKYAFSGTLETGQSRTVDATRNVELRLGNAAGVSVRLNGKTVGSLGAKGQVRVVQFTSGGFQIVAVPKSPPLIDPL